MSADQIPTPAANEAAHTPTPWSWCGTNEKPKKAIYLRSKGS